MSMAGALWRGLVTGISAVVITLAATVGPARLATTAPSPSRSGDDLPVLPGLERALVIMALAPVVLAVLGPLIAHRLGLPEPWLFAMPAAGLVVLACVGIGARDPSWTLLLGITSATVAAYCPIAFLAHRREFGT
ncbi:hypothetical protein ABT369_35430 [Dactylosporangium sp. NPDC000244]|uniref:hypothetical protein n=1 Tax=Dactylosporangium sp. NPDC000244 TaxID=3154365 RepID=UPI0033193E00